MSRFVLFLTPQTRYAQAILVLGLLASLAVAFFRVRVESHANRVELAMDFSELDAVARSYDYNPSAFLIALRRAGLTSLAVTEELGANVGADGKAYATTGAALLNAARISPIGDPLLAQLVRSHRIVNGAVYLLVSDAATYRRYRTVLPLHFSPRSVLVLRPVRPWLIEVRTQIDYFNATALGIPTDQIELAHRLGLLVVPRFQNDERFGAPQIDAYFADVLRYDPKVSTVIFFGLGNQVLGYPDHLEDAANAFKLHPFVNFGSIETYDAAQVQKGNDMLARLLPGRTVRVQAIAKTELDKIKMDDAVGRYVLGVRERNVRLVYLRPWTHPDGNLSVEATNVEMVKAIADELRGRFRLGRATPIPQYHGNNRVLVGLATLAVPSIFVLLLDFFGLYRRRIAAAAYALTVLLYVFGVALHHDAAARSAIALAGALCFATAALLVLIPAWREMPSPIFGTQFARSAGWMLAATGVALLGALVVVGIMSSPLAMTEIERFRGVRLILALPPLVGLLLYTFDRRFGAATPPRDVFLSPVLAYQLFAGIAIVALGALMLVRSGNDSDVSPSSFELGLRHVLTHVLSVRPRFKEFLIGFPCMMLLPALLPPHRRIVGWLLALGIGVGVGDVIDTFSHLHTPIEISILRIVNGLVIGAIVGAIAMWVYRRLPLAKA
ncbi:MAG: hypothetical protein JO146_06475 [Candidatus Eremiobacteraeota bacterium]|nr:hypothetical protein [Candidatus Eremiobacteraeota bacterium]